MTCIAGVIDKGRVFIGGDSAGIDTGNNYALQTRQDPKVFKKGAFVIGFTTCFRMGQVVRYVFDPPEPPLSDFGLFGYMVRSFVPALRASLSETGAMDKDCSGQESGPDMLVGIRGKLFGVQENFQISESIHSIDAVGCGAQFAIGSLWATRFHHDPEHRVFEALKTSETFCAGVRGPFIVLNTREE